MHRDKPPRIYLDDHVYFVTSKTFNNKKIFKDKSYAEIFFNCLKFLEKRGDGMILAVVLLFDHFHLMVRPEKKNISEMVHGLKSYSAQKINQEYRRGILASLHM